MSVGLFPPWRASWVTAGCEARGRERCTIHDLRHLGATISITSEVPLTVVSKTLRHSTLSTTANVYSHLTAQAARQAVDVIDNTLTQAGRDHHAATPRGRGRIKTAGRTGNSQRRRPFRPSGATTMRPRHTR